MGNACAARPPRFELSPCVLGVAWRSLVSGCTTANGRGGGGHVAASNRRGGGRLCLYTTAFGEDRVASSPATTEPKPIHLQQTPASIAESAWLRCGAKIYCEGEHCTGPKATWITRDSTFGGIPLSNTTRLLTERRSPHFITMALLWHAQNGPGCPTQDCALYFDSGQLSTDKLMPGMSGNVTAAVPRSPIHTWHQIIGEIDAIGMLFDTSSHRGTVQPSGGTSAKAGAPPSREKR